MDQQLFIYIDRLIEGKEQNLDDVLPSKTLFEDESELHFHSDITIRGKAYITTDHLVIDIFATIKAEMPCIICAKPVPFTLEMERQTLTIPLEEIKNKVYNYTSLIRESLLLQVPQTKECKNSCPERVSIEPFLIKNSENKETHFPFAELE